MISFFIYSQIFFSFANLKNFDLSISEASERPIQYSAEDTVDSSANTKSSVDNDFVRHELQTLDDLIGDEEVNNYQKVAAAPLVFVAVSLAGKAGLRLLSKRVVRGSMTEPQLKS